MATRVTLDQGGMRALAFGAEGIGEAVMAKASAGKAIAEGLASDFRVSGEYQDSFNVREGTAVDLRIAPRMAAILENTSDHAAAVEWGNAHDSKAHHVLARTVDGMAG